MKLDLVRLGCHHHLWDAAHLQDWSLAATWLAQDSFQRRARRRRRHPTSLKKALPEEREQECSLGETQNIQKLMNVFNQPEGYISWSVCLEKRLTIHMNPRTEGVLVCG